MNSREIYLNPNQEGHPGWVDGEGQPWDVPNRLYNIVNELLSENARTDWIIVPDVHPNTLEIVSRVHSEAMIEAILMSSEEATDEKPVKSEFDIDSETNASAIYPGTYHQALNAAETTLAAVDGLLEDRNKKLTIALSRPPGHHAGKNYYHGFCFFNNAAIAAEALKTKGNKVAIIDIDVHHGDGTQDILNDDPDVLYVSIHASPEQLMPHTGYASETGSGEAKGTILNLPFKIGVSNEEYFQLLDTAIEKITSFGADTLVIEAGFDGHVREWPELPPLTHLDNKEFFKIGTKLGALSLKSLILLGGGYNHDVTPRAFSSFVRGFELGSGIKRATEIYTNLDVIDAVE